MAYIMGCQGLGLFKIRNSWAGLNVINLSLQPRCVSLWRHSGQSRNPVFSALWTPAFAGVTVWETQVPLS
jgi:hypothetical protein